MKVLLPTSNMYFICPWHITTHASLNVGYTMILAMYKPSNDFDPQAIVTNNYK
jgi:hypothetical protein